MLTDLVRRRTRAPWGSRHWFKLWIKRVYNFPALLNLTIHVWRLKARGVRLCGISSAVGLRLQGVPSRLRVGDGTFLGRVYIQLHETVTIGCNVVVNDDVVLLTGTHDIASPVFAQTNKAIVIGDYAWICTGALILPGVKIGKGAVVAAGAVVSKNVEPYTVVGGNPAVYIKDRPTVDFIYRPAEFRACIEAWIQKPW